MPKGYLVGELEVTNPAGYQLYSSQVPPIIAQYGGRYLVRGGEAKLLDGGDGSGGRNVVVEFDSPEQLMKFYNSRNCPGSRAKLTRSVAWRAVGLDVRSGSGAYSIPAFWLWRARIG